MSITEQQLSSFLGKETNLSTTPSLKGSFAQLSRLLTLGHQHRLKEVNNCIIPTVECDLANSQIIIHNWPGENVASLTNSPIHEIIDEIKDLYAYGDRSGRAGVAKKLQEDQPLQNNIFRLCVTYYEGVKSGGLKNSPTPNDSTETPNEERTQYDIRSDGNTAIITFVLSHFKEGKGQPQRFQAPDLTLEVDNEELSELRLALANTSAVVDVVKEGKEDDPRHTIRIGKRLDKQETKELLDVFVKQCCDEVRAYIEDAYRVAAAEHTFPDFRVAYET